MIHGAQGDQSIFNDLAPALASQYRVLTFDQRGSGLSEKPDAEYSIAMLADVTAALMDLLGYCPAHVLGVSMGGHACARACTAPSSKGSITLPGCTTPGGSQAIRTGGSAFANAYSTQPMSAEDRGRALAEAAFTEGYIERHPQIIASMIEARRERPIDLVALGHRLKGALKHDTFERLAQMSDPGGNRQR